MNLFNLKTKFKRRRKNHKNKNITKMFKFKQIENTFSVQRSPTKLRVYINKFWLILREEFKKKTHLHFL